MNSRSKKERLEWSFFINPKTNKIQYNKLCRRCVHDCRQSFRSVIVQCKTYQRKEEIISKKLT